MDDQEEKSKQDLISLLRDKRILLIAGAGSSAPANYPTWNQLLCKLEREFAPQLGVTNLKDKTEWADQIKFQVEKGHRIREYYTFLVQEFKPKPITHTLFHEYLVQLGFCGIATFNYDLVLESAIGNCTHKMSEAIDLCAEDACCRVFDYLRALNSDSCMHYILHLHGLFNNPSKIILTRKEYKSAYGDIKMNLENSSVLMKDEHFNPTINALSGIPLDSLHRKVIWSLLAMHPVLFIGFGMEDEFFLDTLNIVNYDFALGRDPVHFAIMNYTEDCDKEKTREHLHKFGVKPVFYYVPKPEMQGIEPDHRRLEHLVSELAHAVGISTSSPSIEDLDRKMRSL